jgi:hypothetical protein
VAVTLASVGEEVELVDDTIVVVIIVDAVEVEVALEVVVDTGPLTLKVP